MPCYSITVNGHQGIICARGHMKHAACVTCGAPASFECDYPAIGNDKMKTCDNAMCANHSHRVASNVDYCEKCFALSGGEQMTLDQIVARQYANARSKPGHIAREILLKGLIANLRVEGDKIHLQFLRIGKIPMPGTTEWKQWEKEINTCRAFWKIPNHLKPTPVVSKEKNMYAMNFVWTAVEQLQLV